MYRCLSVVFYVLMYRNMYVIVSLCGGFCCVCVCVHLYPVPLSVIVYALFICLCLQMYVQFECELWCAGVLVLFWCVCVCVFVCVMCRRVCLQEFGLSQLREGAGSHSLRSILSVLTLLFYHTYVCLILGKRNTH